MTNPTTIGDLIEALKKMDPSLPVLVQDAQHGCNCGKSLYDVSLPPKCSMYKRANGRATEHADSLEDQSGVPCIIL